jgi:hypothetical protein
MKLIILAILKYKVTGLGVVVHVCNGEGEMRRITVWGQPRLK